MARPKAFDPDLAVEQAMDVFWCRGYEATSIQDLVEATGVARQSLYGTFGSKDGLYLQALDRYRELEGRRAFACLDGDAPPRERLRTLFERFGFGTLEDPDNKGCFVLNAALERADDAQTARRVRDGMRATEAALRDLLIEADLPPGKDPAELARFLTTALQGVRLMAKATRDERLVRASIDVALRALD